MTMYEYELDLLSLTSYGLYKAGACMTGGS